MVAGEYAAQGGMDPPRGCKNRKAIGVALNDMVCKILRDQIGKHSRFMFVHTEACRRDGGRAKISIRKLRVDDNSAWNTGETRCGILGRAGVPLSALQEMAGWESIEMVQRYAHLSPSHLTEHARKIDEVLAGDVTNLALLENVAI